MKRIRNYWRMAGEAARAAMGFTVLVFVVFIISFFLSEIFFSIKVMKEPNVTGGAHAKP